MSELIRAGGKAQAIDIQKLKLPLMAIRDDPTQDGTPGHVAIAPVNDKGEVDIELLEAWAMARGTGQIHKLTQLLLDAVVEPNAMGGTQ